MALLSSAHLDATQLPFSPPQLEGESTVTEKNNVCACRNYVFNVHWNEVCGGCSKIVYTHVLFCIPAN